MGNYIRKPIQRVDWTPEKLDELKRRYPDEGNKALSEHFGCNPSVIKNEAEKLGLKKSDAWKSKNARECGKKSLPKKTEAERITAGMKKRAIFSGFLYTRGNVTAHIGR